MNRLDLNVNPLPYPPIMKRFASWVVVFLIVIVTGCSTQKKVKLDPELLPLDFEVHTVRSDPNRSVIPFKRRYKGPLIDTHVHLDPPHRGKFDYLEIEKTIKSLQENNLTMAVFMPVPNEGQMRKRSDGAEFRKILRKAAGGPVSLFCGSEYITNWLHDAYHKGYDESDYQEVLIKLNKDLADPECIGIGEIGLFHFNKTGKQNVIQFPPTFKPFQEIVGLIAKSGKWLDLHAEPMTPEGKSFENEVFGGIALLYQNNPDLKLIVSHTAMTNPVNARRLLQVYPTMMMNFKPIKKHQFWRNLEPITDSRGRLYEDWAKLFQEMPERFMVGSDEKFGRSGSGALAKKGERLERYGKHIKQIRKILGSLDTDTASKIAHQNARRVFGF